MVKKIGTHNGHFHADEVLACVLLRQLPEYKDAEIVRSRNPADLEPCDIVVDVGAVFDPERQRFDHHQREFSETMKSLNILDYETKLSSAGLVYAYYGKAVISSITGIPKESPDMTVLYEKMYAKFVEEYDGIDNGVNQFDGEPRYHITSTVSARVGRCNPRWNEDQTPAAERAGFEKAMQIVESELRDALEGYVKSWMPARAIVKEAIEERKKHDAEGRLLKFPKGGLPWKSHLFEMEKEIKIEGQILYVVYQSKPEDWRIQCVSESEGSFKNRKTLPAAWLGVRDQALNELTGLTDCTFVHANGFIGGAKSEASVMKMAEMALQ